MAKPSPKVATADQNDIGSYPEHVASFQVVAAGKEKRVVLSIVHRAKGLESPGILVINLLLGARSIRLRLDL
jgi:hypothetical protein